MFPIAMDTSQGTTPFIITEFTLCIGYTTIWRSFGIYATEGGRPEDGVNPTTECGVVLPTCTIALGYSKCTKTHFQLDSSLIHSQEVGVTFIHRELSNLIGQFEHTMVLWFFSPQSCKSCTDLQLWCNLNTYMYIFYHLMHSWTNSLAICAEAHHQVV